MPAKSSYTNVPSPRTSFVREQDIGDAFIAKLRDLKYTDRPDIRDRAALDEVITLEVLITTETQKHEALKANKKGLMQQLFPSPEAQ